MKYKTIVVDPPWTLKLRNPSLSHCPLRKKLPYKTLSDGEIMAFDIDSFAADECDLFLWCTKTKIHTAFHIMEHWGFKYANFFVWNKQHGLNHNGVHNILEFVVYGYKGRIGLNYTKPIDSYFQAKMVRHSQKPDLFYSKILKVTKAPRIDIFARKRHYGFDAWGDQVETQMQVPLTISSFNPLKMESQ